MHPASSISIAYLYTSIVSRQSGDPRNLHHWEFQYWRCLALVIIPYPVSPIYFSAGLIDLIADIGNIYARRESSLKEAMPQDLKQGFS